MTEQEKREKAIEETIKDICGDCTVEICVGCAIPESAEIFYDYIIRKADEVRKEVYEALKKKRFDDREFDKFTGTRHIVLWKDIVEIFKEFGVEVEE